MTQQGARCSTCATRKRKVRELMFDGAEGIQLITSRKTDFLSDGSSNGINKGMDAGFLECGGMNRWYCFVEADGLVASTTYANLYLWIKAFATALK
jgi:hypothetical protein